MFSNTRNRLWLLPVLAIVAAMFAVGSMTVSAEDVVWGSGSQPGERWEVTPTWDEYIPLNGDTLVRRHRDGAIVSFAELEAEYAPQGRFTTYRFASSRSMAPYIDTDDLVFLSWNPVEVVKKDVIGTWQSDCPFTHRVYSIAGDIGYRVRGDNMIMPDRCIVLRENVLYKVVGVSKDFYK